MAHNAQTKIHQSEIENNQIKSSDTNTFSIATPTVTTILPMSESYNDTSFMQPATSYQQDIIIELNQEGSQVISTDPDDITGVTAQELTESQYSKQHEQSQWSKGDDSQSTNDNSTADGSKIQKKRTKTIKKNAKLDAKSKLEKSRQSARECRARKKLRYQYLEDLVCNREKAVVKLREELSMFCEFSKQVDEGNISDKNRQLLTDQAKENNQS